MSIINKKPSYESLGSPEKDWFTSPKKDSLLDKLVFNRLFFFPNWPRTELTSDPTHETLDLNTDAERDRTVSTVGHLLVPEGDHNYPMMPGITRVELYGPYNRHRANAHIQRQ